MTEHVTVRELRARLAKALDAAEHGATTIVTRDGRPVAALVPVSTLQALENWEDEQLADIAEHRYQRYKGEGAINLTEMFAEILG
ncbi:type II toxin-antitoxin system prevent-host-death family antitoxin [Nocardia sp. NPDC049707]|uniref:type II toxin-antitoxin system Phd/YefM family antitoxin n=1 Tax=Nocardia sp. NPDC049707 TaxID=3154735 RepID=UPI00343FC769